MKRTETQIKFTKAMSGAKDNGDSIYNYHLTRRKNLISDSLPWHGFTPGWVIFVIICLAAMLTGLIHAIERNQANASSSVGLFIFFTFIMFMYFLPSLIATIRHKSNSVAIFVLNVLAGWTFVGWVFAIVWACTNETTQY